MIVKVGTTVRGTDEGGANHPQIIKTGGKP